MDKCLNLAACPLAIDQSAYLEIERPYRVVLPISCLSGLGRPWSCMQPNLSQRVRHITFKRQNERETEMRWRKLSRGFATLCLVELAVGAALSNEAVFEAQFLNVSQELKFADDKYGGYEIIEHRVSHR